MSLGIPGSSKAESVRAGDVLTVLREKVAFVSGKKFTAKSMVDILLWSGLDLVQMSKGDETNEEDRS